MWDFNYSDICLVKCILNSDQIQRSNYVGGGEWRRAFMTQKVESDQPGENQSWLYISPTEKQLF